MTWKWITSTGRKLTIVTQALATGTVEAAVGRRLVRHNDWQCCLLGTENFPEKVKYDFAPVAQLYIYQLGLVSVKYPNWVRDLMTRVFGIPKKNSSTH